MLGSYSIHVYLVPEWRISVSRDGQVGRMHYSGVRVYQTFDFNVDRTRITELCSWCIPSCSVGIIDPTCLAVLSIRSSSLPSRAGAGKLSVQEKPVLCKSQSLSVHSRRHSPLHLFSSFLALIFGKRKTICLDRVRGPYSRVRDAWHVRYRPRPDFSLNYWRDTIQVQRELSLGRDLCQCVSKSPGLTHWSEAGKRPRPDSRLLQGPSRI